MPISLDKVLLVVNSDSQVSIDSANYYIAARGLTHSGMVNPHILSFPWGLLGDANPTQAQVLTVANYIVNNSIECVICSAVVPVNITNHSATPVQADAAVYVTVNGVSVFNHWPPLRVRYATVSFANCLGSSKYILSTMSRVMDDPWGFIWGNINSLTFTGYQTVEALLDNSINSYKKYQLNTNFDNYAQVGGTPLPGIKTDTDFITPKTFNWKTTNTKGIPFGRLGVPKGAINTAEETFATTKRVIDDAIANEQSGVSAANLPNHIWADGNQGTSLGVWYYLRDMWPRIEIARRSMASIGCKNFIISDQDGNLGYGNTFPSYTRAQAGSGTIPNNLKPLWSILGGFPNPDYPWVPGVGSYYTVLNNFTYLPGSWGVGGYSFGLIFGADMLAKGGCAFTGCPNEPLADAPPDLDIFLQMLTKGLSMCEAAMYSHCYYMWQLDTWGDPLYRPFGKQNVTLVG